jgi:leucyl aminopeptidase
VKAPYLVLVGLGAPDKLDAEVVRRSLAAAAKAAPICGAERIVLAPVDIHQKHMLESALEGIVLASYSFDKYLTKKDEPRKKLAEICVVGDESDYPDTAELIENTDRWVSFARDLGNEPGNVINPATLKQAGADLAAELGVEFGFMNDDDLLLNGLNAIHAVGYGSETTPYLFWLRYNGDPASEERLALVGKGLTFDSGGICIKPAEGMESMKADMMGSAAVLGAFGFIVSRKLKLNIDCVVGTAENMPSGTACRPGDIVKSYGGKTIEIINTDAEGRLVLIDSISYAVKDLKATKVVDVATLTGAAVIGLGHFCSAVLSNDDEFFCALEKSSFKTGERVWRMPAFDDYNKQIKSKVADLKNTGGRAAGTITAGKFLEPFAEGKPWLHIDIAGTGLFPAAEAALPYNPAGVTGVMVRTLYRLAESMSE